MKRFSLPFPIPRIPRNAVVGVVMAVAIFSVVGIGNHFFKNRPPAPTIYLQSSGITLLGRERIPPLHQASLSDARLKEMVDILSAVPATDFFARPEAANQLIVEILLRWTGADMAAQGAYGPYVDARLVAFLRAMGAMPEGMSGNGEIEPDQVDSLYNSWYRVYEHYRTRLITQAAGKVIYSGRVAYDLNADRVGINGTISQDFLNQLQSSLRESRHSGDVIRAFLDYVDRSKGLDNLSEAEHDMIMALHSR